jgi:Putative auto-transporter adhesin, head GIN domain
MYGCYLRHFMCKINPFHLFWLSVLCIAAMSCGNCIKGTGEIHEEDRLLPLFTEVSCNSSVNVIIKTLAAGEKPKVIVRAQSMLMPMIITRVSGNELRIETEGCWQSSEVTEVIVFASSLETIQTSGSGSLICEAVQASDEVKLINSGSGDIQFIAESQDVSVEQSGSGEVRITGNANKLEVDSSGSGDIEAAECMNNDLEVNLSGSGNVTAYATASAEMTLTGSGNISYLGNPSNIQTKDNGSGEIRAIK